MQLHYPDLELAQPVRQHCSSQDQDAECRHDEKAAPEPTMRRDTTCPDADKGVARASVLVASKAIMVQDQRPGDNPC